MSNRDTETDEPMSTLSFQPEAERFYAEGYWRSGDLWADFAARAEAQPGKVALILDDRRVTYDELRRAAIALSARLAAGSVAPGDVVILLGRHSIEAAVALLGCPSPWRRARAAPADVQHHAAVGAQQPDAREGHHRLRR
jgi:acyl-CoA synthetase (AMP-forming)/AMP-acid ligase II